MTKKKNPNHKGAARSVWNDEARALLKQFWLVENLSASVIAGRVSAFLPKPVTRNSVISAVHREAWWQDRRERETRAKLLAPPRNGGGKKGGPGRAGAGRQRADHPKIAAAWTEVAKKKKPLFYPVKSPLPAMLPKPEVIVDTPEPEDILPGTEFLPVTKIGSGQCRWWHGSTKLAASPTNQVGFCGRTVKKTPGSWCPEHHRLVYEGRRRA
jgi:hypothetical protein